MTIHLLDHHNRTKQRQLQQALHDREGLEEYALDTATVARWTCVPGMAPWLAQATRGHVPFLEQDAREAEARYEKWQDAIAEPNEGQPNNRYAQIEAAKIQSLLQQQITTPSEQGHPTLG